MDITTEPKVTLKPTPAVVATEEPKPTLWDSFVFLVMLIWVVAGIVAFVMSILCFGKSGTIAQQVVGLLLAVFFGPFYWLYFVAVKSYCNAPAKGGRRA